LGQADVLISGGGMVGLPLGLALAQGGLKVVILDTAPPAKLLEPHFDGRVSALAYASVRMLTALGVWDGLAPNAQPIREILVTDGQAGKPASPFSLHFDAQEVGADALGHIAENRHIRAALCQRAGACANLELKAPAAVKSLTVEAGGAVARLADGEEISAALVVAADGRESPLRSQMGVQIIGWSYPQTGIVATVEHERAHNGVAYEHFLPSGPFAILPMTGNRSSLVWTEAKAKAPALLRWTKRASTRNWRAASDRIWDRQSPRARAGPILCPSTWRGISCVRALRWRGTAPMAFIRLRGRG